MNCPSCNTPNPDGSRFCLRCGNPIPAQSAGSATPPPAYSQPQQSGPVRSMRPIVGAPQQSGQPAMPQPDFPPSPTSVSQNVQPTPAYSTPGQPATPYQYSQAPVQQQPQYPPRQQAQQYQRPQYSLPSSSQVSTSTLNIWGPFAGFGARRRHIGWLMDGQAGRHTDLLKSISKRLNERQIPGVDVSWQTLTAKGVLVESRPYFLIRKGLVSLALNVGTFGKDLFISMSTYLKPPISTFRVLFLAAAALFALIGGPIMTGMLKAAANSMVSSLNPFGGGGGADFSGMVLFIMCLLGPLWTLDWIALQLGFLFSIYKFLTEKDFLALLRVKPNEFNEDDLMALEKAVEQTVRSGLDDIGLNPADLKPAAIQGNEQRLI